MCRGYFDGGARFDRKNVPCQIFYKDVTEMTSQVTEAPKTLSTNRMFYFLFQILDFPRMYVNFITSTQQL